MGFKTTRSLLAAAKNAAPKTSARAAAGRPAVPPSRAPRPMAGGGPAERLESGSQQTGSGSGSGSGIITLRRMILTGAFAAVTIVGTIYGAGLKTQHEYEAEKKQIIQATPEDRIKDLEQRKAALRMQKRPLEKKLAEVRARIKAKEALKAEEEEANAVGNSRATAARDGGKTR